MEHVSHEFEPVWNKDSRVLVLGTFPSVKSRQQKFYYGHPQNRFWKVTAALLERGVPERIEEKKKLLLEGHIAVWDVIDSWSLIAERIRFIRAGNVLSETFLRSSHMSISRCAASVSADKHNIVPFAVLVNIPGKKKSLNKRFVETSAFTKILNCSVDCAVV